MTIKIGDTVTDGVTGFTGVVTAVDRVTVQSDRLMRNGRMLSNSCDFDASRLKVTKANIRASASSIAVRQVKSQAKVRP